MQLINREVGHARNQRGRQRELRALSLLLDSPRPAWLTSVRAATRNEDRDGADLVGASDVGALYVQIKGCRAGVREWASVRRSRHIEVAIVHETVSDSTVVERLISAFGRARAFVLAQRG